MERGNQFFGGVGAFIFADLITVPILLIYRKNYDTKAVLRITIALCAAMVVAGYLVELIFGTLGLVPAQRYAASRRSGGVMELRHLAQHRGDRCLRCAPAALRPDWRVSRC